MSESIYVVVERPNHHSVNTAMMQLPDGCRDEFDLPIVGGVEHGNIWTTEPSLVVQAALGVDRIRLTRSNFQRLTEPKLWVFASSHVLIEKARCSTRVSRQEATRSLAGQSATLALLLQNICLQLVRSTYPSAVVIDFAVVDFEPSTDVGEAIAWGEMLIAVDRVQQMRDKLLAAAGVA